MAAAIPFILPSLAAVGAFSIFNTGSDYFNGTTNPGGGTSGGGGGVFNRLDTLTTLLLIGGALFIFVEGKKALK